MTQFPLAFPVAALGFFSMRAMSPKNSFGPGVPRYFRLPELPGRSPGQACGTLSLSIMFRGQNFLTVKSSFVEKVRDDSLDLFRIKTVKKGMLSPVDLSS
jgi:hypothetical protein